MSAKAAKKDRSHLRLYDSETGEITEFACPHCAQKEDELVGLSRALRAAKGQITRLKRELEKEAAEHESWPTLLALFQLWQKETGHAKAKWTGDRFWLALPLWQVFGTGNVAAGIAGLAFDANRKPMKNGKIEVYDDWELLFRSAATLERYIRRRPAGWKLPEHLAEMAGIRPDG